MKRLFVTFLTSCIALSIIGCGSNQPVAVKTETKVVEENVAEVPEVTEEVVEVEEPAPEEVVVEENTEAEEAVETEEVVEAEEAVETEEVAETEVSENVFVNAGYEKVVIDGTYQDEFVLTEYNKSDDGAIDPAFEQFMSNVTVNKKETSLDDGLKIVTIEVINDTTNWSMDYYYFAANQFLVDCSTGKVFDVEEDNNSVNINGVDTYVEVTMEETYPEDYSTYTFTYHLICPEEYNDYGLAVVDTLIPFDDIWPDSIDDIAFDSNTMKAIIIQ